MDTDRHANRTPAHRHANQYQRQVVKVRQAIEAGDIKPSVDSVRTCASCGTARAQAIIAELCKSGELIRVTGGKVKVAA